MLSNGLIQQTRVESPRQQQKFCLEYLAALTISKQRESLTLLSSLCVIVYIQIN